MSASVPQIGKRVKVCRMLSWFVGKARNSALSNKKHESGAMACNFHDFVEASRQNELYLSDSIETGGLDSLNSNGFSRPDDVTAVQGPGIWAASEHFSGSLNL
jgi:hypothetical protein